MIARDRSVLGRYVLTRIFKLITPLSERVNCSAGTKRAPSAVEGRSFVLCCVR